MKIAECNASDQFVDYMYGEMPEDRQIVFEDHLASCQACTDEFAEVANLRFSVYEWRKVEFDPLETPVFAIPSATPSLGTLIANWARSWASAPGYWNAATGFAAILLLVLAGGYFLIYNNGEQLAVSEPSSEPQLTRENATAEPAKPSVTAVTDRFEGAPVTSTAEMPVRPVAKPPRGANIRQSRGAAVSINFQAPPRLNEFEEIQDESLRLSDMFDDIESE